MIEPITREYLKLLSKEMSFGRLLQQIWKQQQSYNAAVRLLQPDVKVWNEMFVLGMVNELSEVLQELNFKRHRRYTEKVRRENVARELADLTKYVICLWQESGFSEEEMLQAVWDKGEELDVKLRTEFNIPKGCNVIVSDLDGTVADFRGGLRKFLGASDDQAHTLSYDLDNNIPFPDYDRLKTEFEASGGYGRLPAYPDAVELLRGEQQRGTKLFFTTARPVDRFQRIWNDTRQWLSDQGIEPEHLLFVSEERIFEMLRLEENGNKVLLLEDNATIALRAASSGKRVWLRKQPYNEKLSHPNIEMWDSFPQAIDWSRL